MLTMKITRYFTNGEIEMAHSLSFDVLNNDPEKAAKAVSNTLAFEVDFPDLGGDAAAWREMTDEEAKDYQERQEAEAKEARLARMSDEDEDF